MFCLSNEGGLVEREKETIPAKRRACKREKGSNDEVNCLPWRECKAMESKVGRERQTTAEERFCRQGGGQITCKDPLYLPRPGHSGNN